MTLMEAKRGQTLQILDIANPMIREQALRFGLMRGQEVLCKEVLPGGPVVLQVNRQELALGRPVAAAVTVTLT